MIVVYIYNFFHHKIIILAQDESDSDLCNMWFFQSGFDWDYGVCDGYAHAKQKG